MPATLPSFSRGLKLARIGVFLILLQVVLTLVMTVKLKMADTADDIFSAITWFKYAIGANIAATSAMLVGAVLSFGELRRARVEIGGLVIGAVGFAVATAALLWGYRVFGTFLDVVTSPDSTLEDIERVAEDLGSYKLLSVAKDLGYGLGLITLMRTLRRSAAANDQLTLRDEAGHMSRALIMMLAGDLFYQFTFGLGDGDALALGGLGLMGQLSLAAYWLYCHVRLQKLLYAAAHFVNEPHDLPTATALKMPDADAAAGRGARASVPRMTARPSQPVMSSRPSQPAMSSRPSQPTMSSRPSQPAMSAPVTPPNASPAPLVIAPVTPLVPIAAPRAPQADGATDAGGAADGPKFLR